MTFPNAQAQVLHTFPPQLDFRPHCGTWLGANYVFGVQHGLVVADRKSWSSLEGHWQGPAALLSVPSGVSVGGLQVLAGTAFPFERVAEGAALTARWQPSTVRTVLASQSNYGFPVIYAWALIALASGAIVASDTLVQADAGEATLPLAGLTAGSYALWVHIASAQPDHLSAASYATLVGQAVPATAFYEEAGQTWFWDVLRNLGRQPLDAAHPLYAERAALEATHATQERPEWAMLVSSAAPLEGEWSCLLIQSGDGDWASGADVLPHPGPALLRDTDAEAGSAAASVSFDYLARRGTAAQVLARDCRNYAGEVVLPKGTRVIGGERASTSGPEMALWAYMGGAWQTVGKSEVHSTGVCECILQAFHTATAIEQLSDGRVMVLNRCSKHLFDPDAERLGHRLPPYPLAVDGHPGGHGLGIVGGGGNGGGGGSGGVAHWLTEGASGGTASGQIQLAPRYNTHQSLDGGGLRSGVGGAYHGPNCAGTWRGKFWTVVEGVGEDPKQYLAWWGGAQWELLEGAEWLASDIHIQRLQACGDVLFGCGYFTKNGRGVAFSMDGQSLQWMAFPYRTDTLSRTVREGREEIVAVAQRVDSDNPNLAALPYVMLRLSGTVREATFFYNPDAGEHGGYCADRSILESLGYDVTADFAPFLLWIAASGVWSEVRDRPTRGPYLERVIGSETVCWLLRCDGSAPILGFGACWPYDPTLFDTITIRDGEGWATPGTTIQNAQAALDKMPAGTKYLQLEVEVSRAWWALQLDDTQPEQTLSRLMKLYPAVWLSLDSEAAPDDLSRYNVRSPRPDRRQGLGLQVLECVRAVVLVPPLLAGAVPEIRECAIQRRE